MNEIIGLIFVIGLIIAIFVLTFIIVPRKIAKWMGNVQQYYTKNKEDENIAQKNSCFNQLMKK